MPGNKLVETVVELTGLASMLGPGTVHRALRDVGANPATATARDLMRALPNLAARLQAFQSRAEAAQNVERISTFLHSQTAKPNGPGGKNPA